MAHGFSPEGQGKAMSNQTLKRLRAEMLQLTASERATLAHDLVKSLDGPADSGAAAAWEAEILGRLEQVERGTAQIVDRAEFDQRMRERLARI